METAANAKTLLLLRHAKSSWDQDVPDHERRLTGRGKRDGVAVGQLLVARGIVPDIVLCSTATRTRETWDRAVKGGAFAHEIRYLDEVYDARLTDLLPLVRALPESAGTVLMIGHGPGIPDLVEFLGAHDPTSPSWQHIDRKFPTAALAVLSVDAAWAHAGESRAQLVSFDVPRGGSAPEE